ncbi:cytochrome-c peroxidase [Enhygromyxa salina]|nr:cytochrome c peroxidase [Enhygromyxa salina]
MQDGCEGTSSRTSDTTSLPAEDQLRGNPNVLSIEELGEAIFFDEDLSVNFNQACADCHGPEAGYTGPELLPNLSGGIYEGSVHGRHGGRRAPSSAYNSFAPVLSWDGQQFVGGTFWDGRATGWRLGDPAAEQAQAPFLNPVEQALADGSIVVDRVCDASYKFAFKWLWGAVACKKANSALGFDSVAFSIAAFETSPLSSPFSSKYDAYLRGDTTLSSIEAEGLALFEGKALCFACHTLGGASPLFTDFTYDNLGVPRNRNNPFYRMDGVEVDGQPINPLGFGWVDFGLSQTIAGLANDDSWRVLPDAPDSMTQLSDAALLLLAEESRGKQKVPTLRNVDLRPYPSFDKSYMHNGYFRTLEGVVHFYNTRDVLPTCAGDFTEAEALALDCWPPPEVSENVNETEMGDLGLSPSEEAAVVAFLGTLSDGFVVE